MVDAEINLQSETSGADAKNSQVTHSSISRRQWNDS